MNKDDLREKYGIELWDEAKTAEFQKTLLSWYDQEKRELPWRKTKDPYKIWVSEIMLQQTRVDTVIPYYERFIKELPNIKALAEASEDQILKLWEGLGYYSRVRNMQTAAQQIMEQFDGKFPENPEAILSLKGIGPYTKGAIASMAFDYPEPAVDGNLMRVMARLFEIDLDVKNPTNRKAFEAVGREIIDPDRPGDFNQALMDLGATIMTPKNYNPELSPVKEFDQSYLNETWDQYPVSSKAKKAVDKHYLSLVIRDNEERYLLEKRPKKGLLANLWTYPLIEYSSIGLTQPDQAMVLSEDKMDALKKYMGQKYGIDISLNPHNLGKVTHLFSHQKWFIDIYQAQLRDLGEKIPDHAQWVSQGEIDQLALPKVQAKIMEEYFKPNLFN